MGLTWWKGFLATAPVDELVLFERLADPLLERVSHPHLRRLAADTARVHLGALRALAAESDGPHLRTAALSREPAEQFQVALKRVEDRLDVELAGARAFRLLCSGAFAQACFIAQSVCGSAEVLQAVLYAQHRARVDPSNVLRLAAKDISIDDALLLAGVLADRSWWAPRLQEFFVEQFLASRPLEEARRCADALGWAQLSPSQLRYALDLLTDPRSPVGFDGRVAGEVARGVRSLRARPALR